MQKTYEASYEKNTKLGKHRWIIDNNFLPATEKVKAETFREARLKLRKKYGYTIKNIKVRER